VIRRGRRACHKAQIEQKARAPVSRGLDLIAGIMDRRTLFPTSVVSTVLLARRRPECE
jgi:hypothetical protein